MYTKAEIEIEQEREFVVPPLSKEAVLRLPSYCRPTSRNLATQYFFLNRELMKDLQQAKNEIRRLNNENQRLEEREQELKEQNEKLKSERDKFREMLFKFNHLNHKSEPKHEPVQRTKESYVRKMPETIDERRQATLKQCPFCDRGLSESVDFYERIIEDIPSYEQLKAKAIKYTIHRYYCKHCEKIISAKPKERFLKADWALTPYSMFYTQDI